MVIVMVMMMWSEDRERRLYSRHRSIKLVLNVLLAEG